MAHTSEHLDLTVTATILFGHQVLLVFNENYKSWFPPGGHIDKDEDPISAIYREIKEETGLTYDDLELLDPKKSLPKENIFEDIKGKSLINPTFTDIHEAGKDHQHVAFRYFFKSNKLMKFVSEDSAIKEIKLFSKEELESKDYDLRDHVRYYCLYAIETFTS